MPAVQNRLNRHFVLVEQASPSNFFPPNVSPPLPSPSFSLGQVVLYDSRGAEEPRVVFPQDGSNAAIGAAAAREEAGSVSILIHTTSNFNNTNPTFQAIWVMSADSGATWKRIAIPTGVLAFQIAGPDYGGAFVRSRYSNVRIGTREFPFAVALTSASPQAIYIVGADALVRATFISGTMSNNGLLGSDREGRQFLVRMNDRIVKVDVDGGQSTVATMSATGNLEGWIAPNGETFLEHVQGTGQVVLYLASGSTINPIAASWDGSPLALPPINPAWVFFAVPTVDYTGAWIVKRGGGRPTQLLIYGPVLFASPLVFGVSMQWSDVSAPEVEAVHAAASGSKLLIQVHRPRQSVDNLLFKDPALAIWHGGDPAPKFYDELFLSETATKGFVHLDVDAVENGEPFVFDSGVTQPQGGIIFSPPPAPSAGGSDVIQEWGVVRASLRQKLVLPGVGRTPGAFGSNWATDVTLYNPADIAITVGLMFLPNGIPLAVFDPPPGNPLLISLQAHEIRMIPDVVGTLFRIENSTGALYIIPAIGAGVNVTSRTYNTTSNGTYGFTMNGIDIFTAAGPRFPMSFSGAFEGASFRTNLMLTDVSGRGSDVSATAASPNGSSATGAVTFVGPESGQTQINGLWQFVGLSPADTGALVVRPNKGETIASVFVVDNRTNDPTFFPPDIPASVMRVIPAIGHLDGANGSKFRSDLYLFNNSGQPKTLTLQAKLWDVPENPSTLQFTLLPFEARVIRDVLSTAFGKTGIARLRFTSQGSTNDTSVRVTSRTYTIDPNGGTYGFLMPPLNSFQSGGAGDTLEILGATLDPHFRTNLGLVDLTAFPGSRPARAKVEIIDDGGRLLDSFEVSIPSAGGMQINDLFHGRGLPDTGKPVLIRVSTIEGMIGAYAAFVDNGTNDPAYVAANLAAKN
ncbi:MAG TPA: hypothetical protein VII32_06750 [Thermoanaerobaculia bacterium]